MEKILVDVAPKAYEVLGAVKTGYRSGQRYAITVRFNWGITQVGAKFQAYTDVVTLQWDRASESVDDLKAKGKAAFEELKAADRSEADLLFALKNLTI